MNKDELQQLRAAEFAIADNQRRNLFARELLNCLGDPDPDLRDGVAYEGLAALLRAKSLSEDTIQYLRAQLVGTLASNEIDPDGFTKPFAALVLSEVARADRITPLFTEAERSELLSVSTAYLSAIRDYRGFDEQVGWRHGVAHAADILMQLSLHPQLNADDLRQVIAAAESQVTPDGHFYVYGEGRRLARPVLFTASRGLLGEEDWSAFFNRLGDPAPLENWGEAYRSQAGLARMHNLRAFVSFIYLNATASSNENVQALREGALGVLVKLP